MACVFVGSIAADLVVPFFVELDQLDTVFCHTFYHIIIVFGGLDREGRRVVAEVVDRLGGEVFSDAVAADVFAVAKLGILDVFNSCAVLFKGE